MAEFLSQRGEYPALAQWTYLNSATYGLLSRSTVAAMTGHLDRRDEKACSDFLSWFDDMDRLRASLGQLIGCAATDIAFLPNAAAGLSLLLSGLDWAPGDQILTVTDEFPNQIYHAALLASRGVELIEVPAERLAESVTPRTRVIAISQVSYSTGFRPRLETLDKRQALLYVDATQCLGALTLDMRACGADMVVVDPYKWMLAPNGAAFAAIAPALRERLAPQVVGWRSHGDWRNVNNLHHGAPVFSTDAERYEGGMVNFPSLYGLAAAVETMLTLGPAAVEARVMALTEQLRAGLRELPGAVLYSDEHPESGPTPITAVRLPGEEAGALSARLKAEHRILTAARVGRLRLSLHFYNDESDIARLLSVLAGSTFSRPSKIR